MRRTRKSFTLIEMLVVISIISILAAMLSPALRNAHRQTIAVSCKNTMRNLGLIINDYLDSYRKLPPYQNADPYLRWQSYLAYHLDRSVYLWQKCYCKPQFSKIFSCPAIADRYPLCSETNPNVYYELHFAMNKYMHDKGLTRLRSPSKRFLIGEPKFAESEKQRFVLWNRDELNAYNDDDAPRHFKQRQTPGLFTDWHVENILAPFAPSSYDKNYDLAYFWGREYSN